MPHFDEFKRRELITLIRIGCSRRAACRHVGCDPSTVRYHAEHDPAFGGELQKAEMHREVGHLQNIHEAAKKNWRASAWALERINPEDYQRRHPASLTAGQVSGLLQEFTAAIAEEVRDPELMSRVIGRLARLSTGIMPSLAAENAAIEAPQPAQNSLTTEGKLPENPSKTPFP